MNKNILFILFVLAVVSFSSCNVGKILDKPAYMIVENDNFSVLFDTMSEKYADREEVDLYLNDFEQKLVESLKTYNINTIGSLDEFYENGNVFLLELDQLNVDESYVTESVYMDSLSDYPETFQVVTCKVSADCSLYEIDSNGNKSLLRSINVSADQDEKLSNSRTFWQVIFGSNKNNTDYTYKELSDDVIYTLCRRSARRVAGKSSRTIDKNQNK